MRKRLLAIPLLLAAGAATALSQNAAPDKPKHGDHPAATYPAGVPAPIITDTFTADPHAIVIDKTYYVYPTVDKENWQTTEFGVWSSTDLIHWKNQGVPLDLAGTATGHPDVSWAHIRAWAPGVINRDGKTYMYFCGEQKIGVAVADKPTGPFKDALGKPLVSPSKNTPGQMIDPCPFLDTPPADNQAYLYYGNGHLYVSTLNKDLISFNGAPKDITPKFPGGHFNEGIFVIKRKDTYYFMWSENDARADNYQVAYGTSKSPLGPIEVPKDRLILQHSGLVKGTGHHAVINVPGTDDWFIFFHRHAVPGGNGFIRETCLEKLEFAPNPAGGPDIIKPVDPTKTPFPEGSKGEPVP